MTNDDGVCGKCGARNNENNRKCVGCGDAR